jgi:serine protease Do
MQYRNLKSQFIAAALLLPMAGYLSAEENKPAAPAKAKTSPAEFLSHITRDSAEVRNAGQVTLSYADVVQNILPSVVSISTYAKKPQRGGRGGMPTNPDDLDQVPPMLREFFREWLEKQGQQPEENRTPHGRQRSQQPQQTGLGSGVILTEDGYIMTNNHVVQDADELKIKIGKFSKEYTAKVIGTDPSTDVALIKIEATGLPHATFGDSTKLRVGDVVLAIGAPMGLEQSVTQGIVSAMGRSKVGIINNKGTGGYENFIQTDAAINPGNSGGPLVDGLGRVIGMNTAIETQSGMFSGIGLAIPIDMALSIVADLLDDGKVDRGYLGVAMSEVDPSVADLFGLKDESGVTVSEVRPGSPAEKAGFLGGDVIISADGQAVAEPSKLRLMVSSKQPGESVKFGVVRLNAKTRKPDHLELSATLDRLTPEVLAAASGPASGNNKAAEPASTFLKGVQTEPLSESLRKEYGIDAAVTAGLVVTDIAEDSDAFRKGLEVGDVIVRVNNQPVKSIAEARANKGGSGDAVHLTISHQGQTKFVVVKN